MNGKEEITEAQEIQKQIMWDLYTDLREHARHSETLRSTMNNYMLIIASALITAITFDQKINILDLPLSLLVCFLGLLCLVFSLSYIERYQKNRQRASTLLKELDTIFFENQATNSIDNLKKNADNDHYSFEIMSIKVFSLAKNLNTHIFWLILPLIVFAIGSVLTVLCILENSP